MPDEASRWVKRKEGSRVPISLACAECKTRNYKTTKAANVVEPIEIKKFCKQCKQHTLHRETK